MNAWTKNCKKSEKQNVNCWNLLIRIWTWFNNYLQFSFSIFHSYYCKQIVRYNKKIIFLASKNHSFHVTPRDKSKPKILRKAQSPNLTFPLLKNFSNQKKILRIKSNKKSSKKGLNLKFIVLFDYFDCWEFIKGRVFTEN